MTPNQKEFEKQVQRLKRIVAKLTKETGAEFIPPQRPKRVTQKRLDFLRKITPSVIKSQLPQEDETGRKPSFEIDIRKVRKSGALDNPKKGYRIGYGNPDNLVHKGNPDNLIHKGNPDNLVHKGNPGNLIHKGNPNNLIHKGNPDNLVHKGNPNNLTHRGFNLTPEQRSANAKKAWETRRKNGWKPKPHTRSKGNPANLTHRGFNLTPEQRSANAKKAWETRRKKGWKPKPSTRTFEERSASAKKGWETRRKREEQAEKPQTTPPREPTPDREVYTTPNEEGKTTRTNVDTGETEEVDFFEEFMRNHGDIPTVNQYALVIENFISELETMKSSHPHAHFILYLIDKIRGLVDQFGDTEVAIALMTARSLGNYLTPPVLYNAGGEGEKYLQNIVNIIGRHSEGFYSYRNPENVDAFVEEMESADEDFWCDVPIQKNNDDKKGWSN